MVEIVVASVILATVVQLGLVLGTVYFAYRITRIVGAFRAWTLVIAGFVLLTLRNLSSLLLILSYPPEQIARLIEQIGLASTIISQVVNIGASVLLLLGVYGLLKVFEHQAGSPGVRTQRVADQKQ